MEEGKWFELKYSRIEDLRAARPQECKFTILSMKKLSPQTGSGWPKKTKEGVAKSE